MQSEAAKGKSSLGQIFVHSVVLTRGAYGPRFLAPGAMKYLMTEDMDKAATLIETKLKRNIFKGVCVQGSK